MLTGTSEIDSGDGKQGPPGVVERLLGSNRGRFWVRRLASAGVAFGWYEQLSPRETHFEHASSKPSCQQLRSSS
jgi:hypothetical protein